jgi:hypothetical protein
MENAKKSKQKEIEKRNEVGKCLLKSVQVSTPLYFFSSRTEDWDSKLKVRRNVTKRKGRITRFEGSISLH